MTPEQQQSWNIISANYPAICHAWAQELVQLSARKSQQRFHRRANDFIACMLNWPIEARCRTVKTWLSMYKLPLATDRLDSFDQFHESTGEFILAQAKNIRVYDLPNRKSCN